MNSVQWNNLLISNLVTESQSILDMLDAAPSVELKSAEQTSLPLLVRQLLEHRAILTELLTKTIFQKEAKLFDEKTDSNLPQGQKAAISQLLSSLTQETNGQSKTSQKEIRPSQPSFVNKNQEQVHVKERPANSQEMESIKKTVVSSELHPSSEKKEAEQKSNPTQLPPRDVNLPKQNPPVLQNIPNKQMNQELIAKTIQKAPENHPEIESKTNRPFVTTNTKEETSNVPPLLKKNDQELPIQKHTEIPVQHELRETLREQAAHSNRNTLLKSTQSLLAKNNQEALRAAHIQQEEQSEKELNASEGFPIIIPYPGSTHSVESRATNRKKKDSMEEDPEEFSQEDEFDEN